LDTNWTTSSKRSEAGPFSFDYYRVSFFSYFFVRLVVDVAHDYRAALGELGAWPRPRRTWPLPFFFFFVRVVLL